MIIRENKTKLLNLRLQNINKFGRHFENWKPSLLLDIQVALIYSLQTQF